MSEPLDGIEEEEKPSIDIWHDSGSVSVVIANPTIIEYNDKLTPGMTLSPQSAVQVAINLLGKALEAIDHKE